MPKQRLILYNGNNEPVFVADWCDIHHIQKWNTREEKEKGNPGYTIYWMPECSKPDENGRRAFDTLDSYEAVQFEIE